MVYRENRVRFGVVEIFLLAACLLICSSMVARARVVEDVDARETADGLSVKITFAFPLRYAGHVPGATGDNVRIQFKNNSLNRLGPDDIRILSERTELTWDQSVSPLVREIFWAGGDASSPVLAFQFSRWVDFQVESGKDLRSIRLLIRPPAVSTGKEPPADEKFITMFGEAKAALLAKDYAKARRLLTKVEMSVGGNLHRQALEYLGLARQRNNQLAHAKAEYEKYLRLYPDGPDAVRVQQRLASLVTAGEKAKQPLPRPELAAPQEEKMWDATVYGSASQFYFRDQISPEGGETRVNVSNLNTNADLNVRLRSEDYDLRFQFVGSHENNFLEGRDNRTRLSRVFLEVKDHKHGLRARVGRQSKSTGGVLGRFDGVDVGYEITEDIAVNAVYGYPVQSSRQTNIDTNRKFYGASLDFGTFMDALDFTAYFIEQKNKGLLDRRAIGGELRYFQDGKSIFAMLDYDLHFGELNLVMINGNWVISPETSLYLNLDYRKSPLLTATNAIQGQGVETLSDLFTLYTQDEIYLFAEDRTSTSKTATFGISQTLNDRFQLSLDLTATNLGGTETSGGVLGYPGTGTEFYSSLQLLGSSLLFDNDSHIIGLRYNDRDRDRTYTLYLNSRFRIGRNFRINPRLRIDYKSDKQDSDTRLIVRPLMKMDYRIGKWLHIELEGGWEWRDETFSGIQQSSTGNYIYAGYRAIF